MDTFMSGLILELQSDALNSSISTSNLLRKALVISKKLGISEIESWLYSELNGYSDEDIPDYRQIHGEIKAWNPYNGWIPIMFEDSEMLSQLCTRKIGQPVSEMETLVSTPNDSHKVQINYPPKIEAWIMRNMGMDFKPALRIPITEVIGILDTIRNKTLDWALELEGRGIIGDGMSFSAQERSAASNVNYHITNHIGSMTNSQIQQDSPKSTQTQNITQTKNTTEIINFLARLKSSLPDLDLPNDDKEALQDDIHTIEHQLNAKRPKQGFISDSLKSIDNILQGCAGSALGAGLIESIKLLC